MKAKQPKMARTLSITGFNAYSPFILIIESDRYKVLSKYTLFAAAVQVKSEKPAGKSLNVKFFIIEEKMKFG